MISFALTQGGRVLACIDYRDHLIISHMQQHILRITVLCPDPHLLALQGKGSGEFG